MLQSTCLHPKLIKPHAMATKVSQRPFGAVYAQKGFGEGSSGSSTPKEGGAKTSKRGKVSSRLSQQKQLERLQAEEREYQAAMAAKLAARQQPETPVIEENSSSSATVPEQITNRMLKRMVMFSIGPVFAAFLLFPLFYYLKKVQGIDLPVWAVYIVQTTIFGGGLLGISYGVISSSWDPRREGSLLGWNEFQTNLPMVLDRFKKKD